MSQVTQPSTHLPLCKLALAVRVNGHHPGQLLQSHGHAGAAVVELRPPLVVQQRQALPLPPHMCCRLLAPPRRRAAAAGPLALAKAGGSGGCRARRFAAGLAAAAGSSPALAAVALAVAGQRRRQAAAAGQAAAGRAEDSILLLPSQVLRRSLRLRLLLILVAGVGPGRARQAQRALPPRALVRKDSQDARAAEVGRQRVRLQRRGGQLARQEGPLGIAPACAVQQRRAQAVGCGACSGAGGSCSEQR